jgi:hypothetical protein
MDGLDSGLQNESSPRSASELESLVEMLFLGRAAAPLGLTFRASASRLQVTLTRKES